MGLYRRVLLQLKLSKGAAMVIPRGLSSADIDSYEMAWYGHDGIEMLEDRQLELVSGWGEHAELHAELRADPRINTRPRGKDELQNDYFPTPDAEVYASMLATFRPRQVIEVGGGFSTLVARRTIEWLGLESQLLVIDPQPRTDIHAAADELVEAYVEDVEVETLPLDGPVLLFIDSSHVTRAGGDVPHLYNRVIPRLANGSIVHAHDIFIPFDYPPCYQARFYTEQYVLHALIQRSTKYEVLFAGKFLASRHADALRHVLGPTVPVPNEGASFWFRVRN